MSWEAAVPANTLGYGTAGVGVRSGKILDIEPAESLAAAQQEASSLNEDRSSQSARRIRWAVVAIVEQSP